MTRIYKYEDESERFRMECICGDCLEGAGLHIPNGAYAIVDSNTQVRVGDLVHCTKLAGTINSYIKQVKGINEGTVTVGTAYADPARDYTFNAAEIFGVITEAYDKILHRRVYVRTPQDNAC